MKNPFIKEDNSGKWIAALLIGTITAGVFTYMYFTKSNPDANDIAEENAHATDYMKAKAPKKRKQKTDIHELESLVMH